jgi:hypothetical protein
MAARCTEALTVVKCMEVRVAAKCTVDLAVVKCMADLAAAAHRTMAEHLTVVEPLTIAAVMAAEVAVDTQAVVVVMKVAADTGNRIAA